jgi:nitronate monooxygenase
MNPVAPPFPLAMGAVDPLRSAFEARERDDFSLLWSGQAAALTREEDAGYLTGRLWADARKCSNDLRFWQRRPGLID